MAKELKVRRLNNGDLYRMMKIMSKSTDEIKKSLKDIGSTHVSQELLGIIIIEGAMKSAEHELKEFLADLVGLSVDEFEKLHFDASIEVIEILDKQEDLPRFLERAKNLTRKIFGNKQTSISKDTDGQ